MNELRNKYVQFHASESEVLTLNRLSHRMSLSLSETMRLLIREAAALRGMPDVGEIRDYEKSSEAQNAAQH